MARKTSLYIDDAGLEILGARDYERSPAARRQGRRSAILREVLRRYDEICRNDLPELAEADWAALLEAGSDWMGKEDVDAAVRMGRLMTAAAARKNERLMRKLFDLGPAHRITVIDFIERYWAAKRRGDQPPSVSYEGTRQMTARRLGTKKTARANVDE